jgi:hypothetical protein
MARHVENCEKTEGRKRENSWGVKVRFRGGRGETQSLGLPSVVPVYHEHFLYRTIPTQNIYRD